jgi:hypothetical protein
MSDRGIALYNAIRNHCYRLNGDNTDPLLLGHSIGCMVFQHPTPENNHTTGTRCSADCLHWNRDLFHALRRFEEHTKP